ncbi:MAG: dihydrolipoyl dehydrogenase [Phycisphaerales bacterium]|nr:MAG: dihydrolipoyl dehydrogenase [Phycisphaerales bacterium]
MTRHDLIVIGAGPGGYVAAIRAAQLGLNVACVEKESALGGTCLRIGCIPSKALLESSERYHQARTAMAEHGIRLKDVGLDLPALHRRKDTIVRTMTDGIGLLFKKRKITRYLGHARLAGPGKVVVDSDNKPVELEARHVLIATGSTSAGLPGIEFDGDRIGTSTEGLAYPDVPEHLVVIGAGYIGLELGTVWLRLGARVTVLEYLDRILPGTDSQLARQALRIFKNQGLEFRLSSRVTAARIDGDNCVVEAEGAEPLRCDRVLVAVGRTPYTENLGLESVGIEVDGKGRISVRDDFATSGDRVYAIGDVIRGPMLAHKAEEEGVACVERIVTGRGHVNYDAIPGVCYTEPEIASVGKTEDELKEAGARYRKGIFQYRANARAHALGQTDGSVKILADEQTDRVLGVHILGARAGDLIAEAVAAVELGATSQDIARCSHAHPTLAEIVKEAALAVDGRPIHA